MIKKYVMLLFCLFSFSNQLLSYELSFSNFLKVEKNRNKFDYSAMKSIFSDIAMTSKELLLKLQQDIVVLGKKIKKAKKLSAPFDDLKKQLNRLKLFHAYAKDNKHCHDAIQFHDLLKEKYKFAFENKEIVELIDTKPVLFGLEKREHKFVDFVQEVKNDLAKVSYFEDCLHADHETLKLQNYVYKIELIKIRNNIIYHDFYKQEKQFRKKTFRSAIIPFGAVGSLGFLCYCMPVVFGVGLIASLVSIA